MQNGICSPLLCHIELEILLEQLVHESEEVDEVGLPGTVRPNQDVEPAKGQVHFLN
jgi:hypothetical protein